MRTRGVLAGIGLVSAALSCAALEPLPPAQMDEQHAWRIEVVQVTDIAPYQAALDGFLASLKSQGIAPGVNLVVNRSTIASETERGGFWNRLWVYLKVRSEALRIVQRKPDLVLTIGTSATKYAREVLERERIPVVFTAVANPLEAGASSFRDGGPGVTGATLYIDMAESLKVVKQVFPAVERVGMVHTDDENGIAHVQAAAAKAPAAGLQVAAALVSKNEGIVPALKSLHGEGSGVQLFAVPLDTYYGLRDYEPARDLGDYATEHRLPVVSLALVRLPGAMLYVGSDFATVGGLSGVQAGKILKRRIKPDVLPILRQEQPTVLVDPARFAALNLAVPAAWAQRKSVNADGFWEIGAR